MSVVFREAGAGDLDALLALLRDDILGQGREDAAREVYVAAFDRILADPGHAMILGEDRGAVVAMYQFSVIPGLALGAMRRAQLESVRVAGERRGQGLGAALLADAEARARAAGCGMIQLTMNTSRTDTARFYGRHGFTPSHTGWKRMLD